MKIKWSRDEINQFEIIENWLQLPLYCTIFEFSTWLQSPIPYKNDYFGGFNDDFNHFSIRFRGHVIFIGKLWRITVLIAIIIFLALSWRLQITCVLEWWIFDFLRYCNLITIIFQLKSFPFGLLEALTWWELLQNVNSQTCDRLAELPEVLACFLQIGYDAFCASSWCLAHGCLL